MVPVMVPMNAYCFLCVSFANLSISPIYRKTDFHHICPILTAKPRIQPAPTSLKALIGQTVVLPCVVQGEPSPQISWLRDGLFVSNDRMLKIQTVQHSDSGTYICVARNSAGEDTIEIVLQVLGMSLVFINNMKIIKYRTHAHGPDHITYLN